MDDDEVVRCNLCSYETTSGPTLSLRHIIKEHKYDSRFIVHCCFPECRQLHPYRKWDSFRKHVLRKHQGKSSNAMHNSLEVFQPTSQRNKTCTQLTCMIALQPLMLMMPVNLKIKRGMLHGFCSIAPLGTHCC